MHRGPPPVRPEQVALFGSGARLFPCGVALQSKPEGQFWIEVNDVRLGVLQSRPFQLPLASSISSNLAHKPEPRCGHQHPALGGTTNGARRVVKGALPSAYS